MLSASQVRKQNISLLIAPGFAESDVVYCLSTLRKAGLPVSMVGLTNKLMHSQHGLVVRPDISINQLASHANFNLIIIPGTYESVINLLTSPDFHLQIKADKSKNCYFAIFTQATEALAQANIFVTPSERVLHQGEQPLPHFCQQLIALAKSS